MKAPPATLNDDRRAVVEATIRQTCTARGWHLIALNVRTNHVHVVLGAESPPEPVGVARPASLRLRVDQAFKDVSTGSGGDSAPSTT